MKLDYQKPELECIAFTAEELMNNIPDGSLGNGDPDEGWE